MLVAVVEVQRYWNRFKQLGCDKKGFINVIQFQESTEYDFLTKNVCKIKSIASSKLSK